MRGERREADADEEPLPTGYGMPARRPDRAASSGSKNKPRSGEGSGEGSAGERGRRRRRRGGKRRGEKAAEERPSKSRSRGSRRDFAPVSGAFDEDDEGLEFLGLEEGATSTQQERGERGHVPADEHDVLVESGLADVLDVPSWVEAIGIVIAGNLDARSRSRDDRHRG